jgi:hypothetical protein
VQIRTTPAPLISSFDWISPLLDFLFVVLSTFACLVLGYFMGCAAKCRKYIDFIDQNIWKKLKRQH